MSTDVLEAPADKAAATGETPTTELKIHEMCSIYPRMNAAEYQALKLSIREHGLQEPVTIWTDEEGVTWLIDGANRRQAVTELVAEGHAIALNGKQITLDMVPFQGTKLEALEFVDNRNGGPRRNYKSSQLAAVAVRKFKMSERFAKQAGLTIPKPEGDLAQHLADRVGTNREYIFTCMTLWQKARELLDSVASGDLNIPQAKAKLREKENPAGDDGKPQDAKAEKPADEVYDGLRQLITDPKLQKVFRDRLRFKEARKKLGEAKGLIDELVESAGGKFLKDDKVGDELVATVQSAITTVGKKTPHCGCLVCSSTGKKRGGERCDTCKGRGWVDKDGWNATPQDLRDKFAGTGAND